MGLLEKLGLRDDASGPFSEWLDEQLLVTASALKAGDGKLLQPLLIELDGKVSGFVREHGSEALVKAIDLWVDRVEISDVFFRTRIFRLGPEKRGAWERALSERSAHGAAGFLALEAALHATGVLLAYEMVQPLPQCEPQGALTAIGDTLWPGSEDDGVTMERLRGFPGYRGIEQTQERLRVAVKGYREAVKPEVKEGKPQDRSLPTLIGREFASQCGARHAIEIRAVGAREFVNTYRQVAAYSGAWFDHRR